MSPATSRGSTYLAALFAVVVLFVSLLTTVPAAEAAAEEVNFASASSSTAEGSAPDIDLVLTYSGSLAGDVEVTISATVGTAEAGDFTLSSTTYLFDEDDDPDSGDTLAVGLTFTPDDVFEEDETLTLTIDEVVGGAIGAQDTHIVTILNDDVAPTLEILDASEDEDDGPMTFTVRRTGLTELAATATATPSGTGSATPTIDFATAGGPISVPPGGAIKTDTFKVDLVDDEIYEADETFAVTLSDLDNAAAGDLSAIGTIVDDDLAPTLSIDDVTVDEDEGIATFTVTRTGRTAFDADVDVATEDGTAIAAEDYTATSDTLSIGPGGATATEEFVVPITDDDFDEDAESFEVKLSDPDDATIADGTGTGTITDDDSAGFLVDEGDGVVVLEGDAPDTFTVALTSEPRASVTVTVSNADGQTTASPSQLTFAPAGWDTPQEVTVTAIEDGMDEDDPHSSVINLAAASSDDDYDAAPLGPVSVTVGDADALVVAIEGPSYGSVGTTSAFTAMVNAGGSGTITYDWSVFLNGNPIADGDEATFQFTPAADGKHIISAVVGDDQGQNPAVFVEFTVLGDIASSVFAADIVWLANEGITFGCNPPDNDQFCPDKTVTRGQMAAFLVRFLGLTAIDPTIEFTDTVGNIFEQDILKLATAGITLGCNPPANDEFCPAKGVTRGQMAAFLVRAVGLSDDGGGNLFDDDDGSVFESDIDKLATAEITLGCNPPANTNFCPDKTVTRGQMAAFLRRAEVLIP